MLIPCQPRLRAHDYLSQLMVANVTPFAAPKCVSVLVGTN